MRIAFHATMKPPDHPVPSGDREMARVLMTAAARFADVRLASRIVQRGRDPGQTTYERVRAAARVEAERLISEYTNTDAAWRPDAWLTYHLYYKAPDWLGSSIAAALDIPYVVVEASYAGKRDRDAWAPWQADAVAQLRQASAVFAMSAHDRRGLAHVLPPDRIRDLRPFIDTAPFARQVPRRARSSRGPVRIVTVAMMREGAKTDSYRALAAALRLVRSGNWHIEIIGDGPAETAVRAGFAGLDSDRVSFTGRLDADTVRQRLSDGDIFVWPGIAEGFGMAYLEAQAARLPVAAFDTAGVPSVVEHGITGLLSPLDNVAALARSIDRLVTDHDLRAQLSANARRLVLTERGIDAAANALEAAFADAASERGPRLS